VTRRTAPERATRTLPEVSAAQRAAILELPVSAVTHAALLAELPFVRSLELAPPPDPPPAPGGSVRVVAWNAERCPRVDAAAGLLAATGADAFLLSELDWGMARSGQRHAARELAAALGCGYVFAAEFLELGLGNEAERARHAGQTNAVGYHGGAILSRHPLLDPALVRLGGDGDWFDGERGERRVGGRIAVVAKLAVGGAEVALASVHLESHADPAFRAEQMRTLLAALERHAPGAPALVGGDVNAHSLGRRHFRDRAELRAALEEDPGRLARPVPHEPLFAVAEAAGFDWRGCNAEGSTERRRAPQRSARGVLKLDWFFARRLATSAPEVIPAVDGAGEALSDHEAIAVTVAPLG
jgi:endonuclease/exonuclease/phosphatase family metal-dependent hydrolase